MKGKGEKGKSSHNSSSLLVQDVQECFATIKTFDHIKHCPKYTSMVSKDEDCEYSDLDQFESEMQTMLSFTLRRLKNLNNEVHGLNSWQEKTKLASSPSTEQVAQKRGSKGKLGEERPPKRVRTDSGRATYAVYTKGKDQQETTEHYQVKPPKNVTPSRFWAMVDSYCAEITAEDIEFLEEQINVYGSIGEYLKVPPLGRHYTEEWNEEDVCMEEKEANKVNKRYNTFGSNKPQQQIKNSIDTSSKKLDNSENDCMYGELAQRLVQGLVEQDVMMPPNEDFSMPCDEDLSEFAQMSSSELAQHLNIRNSDLLEQRLKSELLQLGILDEKDHEFEKNNEDEEDHNAIQDDNDEVLRELRRKQAELKMLSAQNVETLKELLKCAKEELVRKKLEKKLNAIDLEVTEAYKKYQALKAKRKTVSKKDSEVFFRLLNDRKVILKQLNKKSS